MCRTLLVLTCYWKRTDMSITDDITWGHLAGTEHVGRASQSSDYTRVQYEDTCLPQYENCMQAGHCMIYSKTNAKAFDLYEQKAVLLMQMRFDGYLGFPGGLIDEGESVVFGVNRELVEEVNYDLKKFPVSQNDHVISHWNGKKRLMLHFYAVEVPISEIKQIENNTLDAKDFGEEVLGSVRVPLYTMGDGYRGFPAFLTNAFAGNSRDQLLEALVKRNIMTQEEIERALKSKPV